MIRLDPENWPLAQPLFEGHARSRPFIDATFEGYFDGSADEGHDPNVQVWVNDQVAPTLGQLVAGHEVIPGGDSDSASLPDLCTLLPVSNTAPDWSPEFVGALLTPENDAWHHALINATGRTVHLQRRKIYSSDSLDLEHLDDLSQTLPSGFELRRFDRELAVERGVKLESARLAFVRLERFFEAGGVSFWVFKDGKRVSEATSFGVTKTTDVGVGTEPGFERLGLATAASAAMLAACIRSGIAPIWRTTENPRSDGLALKLGYRLDEEFGIIGFRE